MSSLDQEEVVFLIGGRGQIGSEVALGLVREGYSVFSLDSALSDGATGTSSTSNQGRLRQYAADSRSPKDMREALRICVEEFGVPSGFVYLAHYKGPTTLTPNADFFSSFEEYPLDEWRHTLDVNLTGLFVSSQIVGGAMARAGRGSIVTVSSTYGLVGPSQEIYGNSGINSPIGYATTKAGTIGFTRYLASYWGREGVRSNCLVPGGVYNENQTEEFQRAYVRRTSLGRMATPKDYVGPIRYLLSEESSYMNGSLLVVDGGWTAK